MELLKLDDSPARYLWKDVTLLYRTKVTTEDKWRVDTAGAMLKDGSITFTPWEIYTALIKTFVVGWEGVTADGKAVPYSYEAFLRLPSDSDQDLIMKLGIKIGQDTGFLKTPEQQKAEADLKNG